MIFCDTSTLAKFYVAEEESAAVRNRLDQADRILASELAKTELMGVFHRFLRERKWKQGEFAAALRQFNHDDGAGYWSWVPLDRVILDQAARTYATLPGSVFLRTADCLHLVTALHHGFGEIHTHDSTQAKAAPALGLKAVTIS